jgi:tRNA (guanosine-2'-O-)-methyltransferase
MMKTEIGAQAQTQAQTAAPAPGSGSRVVEALREFVSEARQARIETVLGSRLARLTVVIENLHDPHNGAAALRSVEGFGLCELHVVEAAEPFRFSSRVTQGCEKWVELHRHPTFAACAGALHARGFELWAALPPDAGRPTASVGDLDVGRPLALVFGNEHAGLTAEAAALCDGRFSIPMTGMTGSFNLSVSVALSVFDCAQRRRARVGGGDLDGAERAALRDRWYRLSVEAADAILARRGVTPGG